MEPISPPSISSLMRAYCGQKRRTCATMRMRPWACAASKHALGRSGIKRHGLFAEDVAAALGGLDCGLLVEIGREADDDGVKAVVTKQLRVGGVNLQAWKRIANLFRLTSGHRQHLNARNFSGRLQMDPSDVPHAGNSQIEHVRSSLIHGG